MNRETTNDFDILNRIDEIEDQYERFQALLSVAPNLGSESLKKALEVAEKIKHLSRWHEVLISMAPHFTNELFFKILNTPAHHKNRGATLINLSPHIPSTLFTDALKITSEINRSNISASVLNNLIPRIEDPINILEALKVLSISVYIDSETRANLYSQLQPWLQRRHDLLPEALKMAKDFLSTKDYHACSEILINLIPYLQSNNLLLQALKIAYTINDTEASNFRINALTLLNHNISESYFNTSDNNDLCLTWDRDSENWKRCVPINFQENLRWIGESYSDWMWTKRTYSEKVWRESSYENIYAKNLAVWRAIGNEVIDQEFCQAPRLRAKVLALLYYYFEGKQKAQIFEQLLETIEEIPSKSCKARSCVELASYLSYPTAIKIMKRAISIVKEIYEDILNNDLRNSRLERDIKPQFQEEFPYAEIQKSYLEIQRLEDRFYNLKITILRKELLELIEVTDYFLFPYPRWWNPKMIEGLPPALIALEKPSESRYADFTFYTEDRNGSKTRISNGQALKCAQWYQLEVAVRVDPTGVPSQSSERHPILEPKQQEPVTIVIAAEGEGFEIKEPVQTLKLPFIGNSTENAFFQVRPLYQSASDQSLASIRVRSYYEFNLLEVSVIQAEVVGKFDDSSQSKLCLEKPISFRQERLEREYLNFDEIQSKAMHIHIRKENDRFLFNFTFYNNLDQKVEFTAPIYLPAPDLEDALLTIRKTWYDIAMSKTFTERVEGDDDEFLTNIRRLAKAGRTLWMKLFKLDINNSMYKVGKWLEENPLLNGAIIQISLADNATDFVFPWSLIYDRPIPKKDYELPELEGFWGLRYCIEQQLPTPNRNTDKPFQIQDKLRVGFMLWDQFSNANEQKTLMKNWTQDNSDKLEISHPITNADECYELLNKCDAHILYFYTHGYTRHRQADIGIGENLKLFTTRYEKLLENDPRRELWKFLYESVKQEKFEPDHSWIEPTYGKLYLQDLYDNIVSIYSEPLVFLNMCESAQITPSLLDSFIHFFINRGAKGVIGTECPMTVEFAHPFSEKFLGDLFAGETVGNALLNARCHFMELKNPLGLAYTLFGSATTCFKPAILAPLTIQESSSISVKNFSIS
jgi:CHAT domain